MKKDLRNKNTRGFEKNTLIRQVRNLNSHTAKEKKTLNELLNEENPSFITKKDEEISIEKEELKEIADILPAHLHSKLKLPIYIEIGKRYGKGKYRIQGKVESKLVKKILDKEENISDKEIFINKAELRETRKKLKTTTKYTFTIDLSEITKKKRSRRSKRSRKRNINNPK